MQQEGENNIGCHYQYNGHWLGSIVQQTEFIIKQANGNNKAEQTGSFVYTVKKL